MQKIQWNSSKEGAREKALVKLPISKIEGPAPQFWKKALPLKNDQFRGQKHLENAPKKFYTIRTYIKLTFCKKIGPRPILPSAVVQIFHCRSYGRKSADRTKPEFDVIFIGCFRTLFRWLRVVLWQKLKQFLKIYEWQSVYIPLFGPLLHQWPV